MTTFDDAKATWELLTETERAALGYLGCTQQIITPQDLGKRLNVTWQRAASIARQLKALGLVKIKSLPKQTSYEISGQGEACLQACLQASRPVTELEGL